MSAKNYERGGGVSFRPPIPVITIRNYNFGDALSVPMTRFLAGSDADSFERFGCERRRLSGIGSVAFLWTGFADVWGSGILDERRACAAGLPGMRFFAVRGPKTRAFLLKKGYSDVPETFGDPGIFAPAMYSPVLSEEKTVDIGIVCHHGDDVRAIAGNMKRREGTRYSFISTAEPCDSVVRKISSCRRICASSLHGIVVAEAMGIPCSWFRATDVNDPFKFVDYFLGSGRKEESCLCADVRAGGPFDFSSMSMLPRPVFNVRGLLDSFPYGVDDTAAEIILNYFKTKDINIIGGI